MSKMEAWRKRNKQAMIADGSRGATEVTGSGGGDHKPVTPGAHPILVHIGNSLPELFLGSRS